MLLSARSKRLSREVTQRDEWLLQREARIASLEATISELEATLRERERPYAAITTKSRRFDPVGIALKKSVMLPLRNTDVQRRGSSLPGYVPIHAHAIAVKPGRA